MWAIQPGPAAARRSLPSGAFSPLSLNPVFGVDAFSLSASPVSSWVDLGSGGHNLTQATGSKQPLWGATAFNTSYPGVTFDGVDDFLQAALFTLAQPLHYFLVCNLVVTSANKVMIDGRGAQAAIYQAISAGNATVYAGSNGPNKVIGTTPHVISAKLNNASSSIALDGGSAATGTSGAANPGGVTLGADLTGAGGSNANVIFGAAWIFSPILSASDETNMVRYLGARYGITVA